jgi:hypothetical protein
VQSLRTAHPAIAGALVQITERFWEEGFSLEGCTNRLKEPAFLFFFSFQQNEGTKFFFLRL